jgi:hypothetical protein
MEAQHYPEAVQTWIIQMARVCIGDMLDFEHLQSYCNNQLQIASDNNCTLDELVASVMIHGVVPPTQAYMRKALLNAQKVNGDTLRSRIKKSQEKLDAHDFNQHVQKVNLIREVQTLQSELACYEAECAL